MAEAVVIGPDAHQFAVTARVRASETLANTVDRVFTVDEFKPVTTITFDYPREFQHLATPGEMESIGKLG